MGDRGRIPAASLAVASTEKTVTALIQRPEAPRELTQEQAQEWADIVGRLPADWFPRETWGMLAQYCRHVVASRRIGQLIARMEEGLTAIQVDAEMPADDDTSEFNLDNYDKLLKMQEREGRALSSLATRMRLSQQSTFDKERKKDKSGKRPWQIN
jgi:hypothetical protein